MALGATRVTSRVLLEAAQSRRGFTRQLESLNLHISGPGLSKTSPKFNEKIPKRGKKERKFWREGKIERHFGWSGGGRVRGQGSPASGVPVSGGPDNNHNTNHNHNHNNSNNNHNNNTNNNNKKNGLDKNGGWAPNQEKVGPERGEGVPKGGAPKGGVPKGGAPSARFWGLGFLG